MRATPGPGHPGQVAQRGEGFQVQRLEGRAGNPEPAVVVLAALADNVTDGRGAGLAREGDDGVAVVADESSAEGADPRISLVIEVDTIDILVGQTVFTGEAVQNHVILGLRLGAETARQEQRYTR